jgi:hypothetical protein
MNGESKMRRAVQLGCVVVAVFLLSCVTEVAEPEDDDPIVATSQATSSPPETAHRSRPRYAASVSSSQLVPLAYTATPLPTTTPTPLPWGGTNHGGQGPTPCGTTPPLPWTPTPLPWEPRLSDWKVPSPTTQSAPTN